MRKRTYDIVETMTIEDLGKMIDSLAIMMAKGFEEVKEDLRNEIVPRLTTLERKMDAVRSDVSTLVYDGKRLKGRVEKLEDRVFGSIQEA